MQMGDTPVLIRRDPPDVFFGNQLINQYCGGRFCHLEFPGQLSDRGIMQLDDDPHALQLFLSQIVEVGFTDRIGQNLFNQV